MVNRRFGGVVVGLFLRAVDDEAGHRTDIDNAAGAAIDHAFPESAAAPEDPVQVDVDDFLPDLVRHCLRRMIRDGDSRIVDQDIDASVPCHDDVVNSLNSFGVGYFEDFAFHA